MFTAFCLLGAVVAQSGPIGAGTSPAGGGQDGAAEPKLRYARVVVDQARLYCWPSAVANPPHYEDALEKGQVVQVGRTEGSFVQVVLPHG
ncbi:MAG: hypothetical protein KDC98_17425, partial [Planctomycetes bacterium]|nr:hypothetical protein [Planctomycetota bacterium]